MDQTPRRGIHALASMLPRVTAPMFKKRGFAEAGILTDWPAIVGPHLARHTMPEKIAFARGARTAGTLHVVTESAFAPELQHVEPQVIERINGYFGYYAVSRLRIQHGRVVRANLDSVVRANVDPVVDVAIGRVSATPAPQNPGMQERAAPYDGGPTLDEVTAGLEAGPLRDALERLGRAIAGRRGRGPIGPRGGHGTGRAGKAE